MPGLTKIAQIDPDMCRKIISVMMVQEERLPLTTVLFFVYAADKEVHRQAKGKEKLYENDCHCKCTIGKNALYFH